MEPSDSPAPLRRLTAEEVAYCSRTIREQRKWSQEQLAEISGLNVRTIQRVESGQDASFDTRRALADAFGLDDIDTLNNSHFIPTAEDIQRDKEQFEKENILLPVVALESGRALARLAEACELDLSEPTFDLNEETAIEFAELVDYFREYRECADLYSEAEKVAVYGELQVRIETLGALGIRLCCGTREVGLCSGSAGGGEVLTTATVLYVVAFPADRVLGHVAVPRRAKVGP